jgi:hypothetical protein
MNTNLNLAQDIIPNQGLGGVCLRIHITELGDLIYGLGVWKPGETDLIAPFEARYTFGTGEIAIGVDVRNGLVYKVIASGGYRGKLFGQISLGMLVSEAFAREPRLYYDEGEEAILCAGVEGVVIDVPVVDPPPEEVRGMRISAISVFASELILA